jgi:hypothetical protein
MEYRVVRVLLAESVDPRAVEQRARLPLARVPEPPQVLAIARCDRHLDRMLDPVAKSDVLDEPDGALDCPGRVVLEPERERKEEERLGVGRALDVGVKGRVDREHELSLHVVEPRNRSVVHPQPATIAERVAVRLLYGRPRRCSDVREDESRADVPGKLAQVAVVPGRLDALEDAGLPALSVPADAEAVAVGRLGAEPGVEALIDQRVGGFVEELLQQDRRTRIGEPAAHISLLPSP